MKSKLSLVLLALMVVRLYAASGATVKMWEDVKRRSISYLPNGQIKFKDKDKKIVILSGTVTVEEMEKLNLR